MAGWNINLCVYHQPQNTKRELWYKRSWQIQCLNLVKYSLMMWNTAVQAMRTSNERFLIYHLSVIDGSSENFSVFHIFSSILERGVFWECWEGESGSCHRSFDSLIHCLLQCFNLNIQCESSFYFIVSILCNPSAMGSEAKMLNNDY